MLFQETEMRMMMQKFEVVAISLSHERGGEDDLHSISISPEDNRQISPDLLAITLNTIGLFRGPSLEIIYSQILSFATVFAFLFSWVGVRLCNWVSFNTKDESYLVVCSNTDINKTMISSLRTGFNVSLVPVATAELGVTNLGENLDWDQAYGLNSLDTDIRC